MKKMLFILILVISLITIYAWAGSKIEDLQLQANCKILAKDRFKEEFDYTHYAYNNHYNSKLNKCFMWVWSLDGATVEYLYDVNEKQFYGMKQITKDHLRCQKLGTFCKSDAEWESFVKTYMEE
ncbi:MAG: hypothetical protein ABSB79_13025 [Syntrophales bacterium]|jgi:hypothetical protein